MVFNQITPALVLLFSFANAHMTLNTPKPYGSPSTSPLTATNYPCQLQGDPASFYVGPAATKMAVGEDQKLSLAGSASHAGGSCQLAVTSDLQPTAKTHWQVIKSFIGGCPTKGNSGGSDEYSFQIPSSVASGKYTFAWTWIAHSSGVPEFYMNCAPIEVTGGASKRSLNESIEISSLMKRDALPDLFVANLQGINDCKTVGETDPIYPNPGDVIEKPPGSNRKYQDVVGTNCCPEKSCKGGSGGGSSGSSSDQSASSAVSVNAGPAASSAASSQGASSPATGFASGLYTAASASPTASRAATSVSIFSVSGFGASSSAAAISTKPSTPSGFVTSVTSVASVSSARFTNTTTTAAAAGSSSSGSSSSSSSSSTSSTGGLTGACTSEGMFNCPDGNSYQQCASGSWTLVRGLAGTKCKVGQSMTLWRRQEF